MRKIEVYGIEQQMLEKRYHDNIHACNERIRKNTATYNNWENADERVRSRYTKEEYKEQFIDHWFEERRNWIFKLRDVRQGFIYE